MYYDVNSKENGDTSKNTENVKHKSSKTNKHVRHVDGYVFSLFSVLYLHFLIGLYSICFVFYLDIFCYKFGFGNFNITKIFLKTLILYTLSYINSQLILADNIYHFVI